MPAASSTSLTPIRARCRSRKPKPSHDGKTIRVFLELRAGGYNGSTYTLVYDPGQDQRRGVYYQSVAKQRFDVMFARVK